MHIVIAVAIIKGQCQQCTLITSILSILGRSIQFLKSLFQMQHTVVTPQIEEMATQVSPSCTVVSEDNQALPQVLSPPSYQFNQPTIVKTCSHYYSQLLTHELLPSTLCAPPKSADLARGAQRPGKALLLICPDIYSYSIPWS